MVCTSRRYRLQPGSRGPHHPEVFEIISTQSGSMIACTGAIIDGIKTGGIFVSHDRGATWPLAREGENVYCAVDSPTARCLPAPGHPECSNRPTKG